MDLTLPISNSLPILKRSIVKKAHFIFTKRRRMGCLRLFRTRSNIYMLFQDIRGKNIITVTSGAAGITGNKRKKRVPQAVENIFKMVYPYMRVYRIKRVNIILNTRFNACYYTLLRCLDQHNLRVYKCSMHRRVAFNGCKSKRPRRV